MDQTSQEAEEHLKVIREALFSDQPVEKPEEDAGPYRDLYDPQAPEWRRKAAATSMRAFCLKAALKVDDVSSYNLVGFATALFDWLMGRAYREYDREFKAEP